MGEMVRNLPVSSYKKKKKGKRKQISKMVDKPYAYRCGSDRKY